MIWWYVTQAIPADCRCNHRMYLWPDSISNNNSTP